MANEVIRGTGGVLAGEVSDMHRLVKDLEAYTRPFESITNPGITDDISKGFQVGQHWINTSTDDLYTCMDNTLGAAVWAISSASPSTFPMTDYVVIESKDDLPTPSVGAITLAADTVYQFNGAINLGTDHLAITNANTYLLGQFSDRDTITYTGTGGAIRVSGGVDFKLKDLGIVAFAGTGFVVEDAPFSLLQRNNFIGDKWGTFTDCVTVVISDSNCINVDSGLDFVNSSTGANCVLRGCTINQAVAGTGVLVDYGTSVWDFIEASNCFLVSAAGGTDVSGEADNANLAGTTGRGVMNASRLNGPGTHLTGIDPDDVQWQLTQMAGVADSRSVGSLSMSANATATIIAIAGTMVKVAGTTTLISARKFSDDGGTDNRLLLTGTEIITALVSVSATVTKVGGTVESGSLQIFKNGIAVAPPVGFVVSNQPRGATISIPVDLDPADYIEIFITNEDDTNDITVVDLVMTAIGF